MISAARYSRLFGRAMALWGRYGTEYRTLIPTYEELLQEKRSEGIRPLWSINKGDLEEYPIIDFLELEEEEAAEEYLLELHENKLVSLLYDIDHFADSYIRRLLRTTICDFRHQIRLSKSPKTPLAMDPDYGLSHVRRNSPRNSPNIDCEF